MKDLLLKLKKLPVDCDEFCVGFQYLLDNIDSLNVEDQMLFADVYERYVKQDDENERVRTK